MKLNALWIFALGVALGAMTFLGAPGAVLAQDDDEDAGVEEYEDDEYEEEEAEDQPAPQRAREDRPREQRQPRQRAQADQPPERRQGGGGDSYIERPFTGQRPFQLDVHAGFTFWGLGFATGARFGIPLLHNGFIPNLNNAVYLNFGLDFYYIRSHREPCAGNPGGCDVYGPGFGIPVALHWEFYFSDQWSAFAEIGAQFFAHPAWLSGDDGGGFRWREPGAWFVWALGGSYHFNENILLTVRVGSPYIAGGLTFQF